MHCQIRATPKLETAHQRDLNTCSPCLALGTVCQTSLFFSLVSSIALKMEQDSSKDVLGVLLLIMLALPPVRACLITPNQLGHFDPALCQFQVIAFLFESELDFEEGCHVSKIKKILLRVFESTFGRCFDYLFKVSPDGSTRLGRRLSKLTSTLHSSLRKATLPASTEEVHMEAEAELQARSQSRFTARSRASPGEISNSAVPQLALDLPGSISQWPRRGAAGAGGKLRGRGGARGAGH